MSTPARTTAPVGTALVRREEMPTWLAQPLEKYINNPSFDLLLPSIPVNAELARHHRVSISVVQISANPDDREVFKVGKRDGGELFAYSKPALEKIAEAAGIQIATQRQDDQSNPEYCEFKARGFMRSSSGQGIIREASKAFFMPDVELEAMRAKGKWEPKMTDAQLRDAVAGEMALFRKHLLARTESGAMLRVIRNLLAIKSGLTAAQVAKPKVLVRIDFQPDASDPEANRFLLEQGANASRALWGPDAQARGKTHIGEAEVVETERARQLAAGMPPTSPEPAPVSKPEPTQEELLRFIEEGCSILGLDIIQRNDLFTRHKGDLAEMKKDLDAQVTARDEGGAS